MMNRNWLHVSFLYLLLIALMGGILRLMRFFPLDLVYNNLLHTHSHIAFLGWVYNALYTILIYLFLKPEQQVRKAYRNLFVLTQVANIGMLSSYPVQGYGLYSISFTSMHIFCSCAFAYLFLKDARKNPLNAETHLISYRFIKSAIFFMVISAIGPFAMGPVIAITGPGSQLYFNAIYLYLHFQYNGWFTFSVLGIFFWLLEKHQLSFNTSLAISFYRMLLYACIPSYFLSVLWIKPAAPVYLVGGLSAWLQIAAVISFLLLLKPLKQQLKTLLHKTVYFLFRFALLCFLLKNIAQLVSAVPYFADLAYHYRNFFIIGYLHVIFLGFVSFFLLAFLIHQQELPLTQTTHIALTLFLAGFIISESILFLQGGIEWIKNTYIPYFFHWVFYTSLPMIAGVLLLTIERIRKNNPQTLTHQTDKH